MEIVRVKTESGDIIIWKTSENIEELENSVTLSVNESEYYCSISSPDRRKEWLASRVAVRKELGGEVSTEYDNGIPKLVGSNRFISISHCNDLVAIYISDTPCGIDIEDSTRNFSRVASRFLSEEELTYIKDLDIALAWGIKEAAYKQIGVSDIDFATMFKVKMIDREMNTSVLSYNNTDYTFKFIALKQHNLVWSFAENNVE